MCVTLPLLRAHCPSPLANIEYRVYVYENSSKYSYQRKHSPHVPISPKWGFCEPECGQLSAVLAYSVGPHPREALREEQPIPVPGLPLLAEQPSGVKTPISSHSYLCPHGSTAHRAELLPPVTTAILCPLSLSPDTVPRAPRSPCPQSSRSRFPAAPATLVWMSSGPVSFFLSFFFFLSLQFTLFFFSFFFL